MSSRCAGPSVFRSTGSVRRKRAAFRDGWFRTGDVAVVEDGSYRLLGRTSVDIIKTGGFKVSALEIEEVLRTHPAIAECAVVGVHDEDGANASRRRWSFDTGATLSLDDCSSGRNRSSRHTRFRARSSRSPLCRAMRWARWSNQRLPGSSNRDNLLK